MLVVSNRHALEGMKAAAERLGFTAEIRGSELTGEADDVGAMIADAVHAAPPKTALLWAGETTVTVHNAAGRGGRNLELCASRVAVRGRWRGNSVIRVRRARPRSIRGRNMRYYDKKGRGRSRRGSRNISRGGRHICVVRKNRELCDDGRHGIECVGPHHRTKILKSN